MADDNLTEDMEENDDEHAKDEGLAQTWKFRSGEALDDAALAMNHSLAPESESESARLFALFARDDAVKHTVYDIASVPSSIPTPAPSSSSEDAGRLSRSSSLREMPESPIRSNRPVSYLGPRIPPSTDAADLARACSTSTLSSASGDPLASSHLDTGSAPKSPDARPPVGRGLSTQTVLPITHPEPNRPTSVPIALIRRDGAGYPSYPNQSFSALHSQSHTLHYPSRPLRARNSHSSQNSLNASVTGDSRYAPTMASGARTVGSTPIHSPHLFTPTASRNRASGDESEDSHYNTPLLHHTHLQAPKETNKLQKEFDPVSGRKMVNNYEVLGKLGSGAHGTVKLGKNIDTDELVAIKIVPRFSKKARFGKAPQNPDDMTKKEVAILKKARHQHVVSLLEVIDDDGCGKVYLVLEYVKRGEIVWRKQTNKDIARFEMSRVSREKSGHIDEDFEIAEIERFNAMKLSGRENKAGLPQGPDSELDVHKLLNRPRLHVRTSGEPKPDPDEGPTPFWSLEYANDSEEEHSSAFRPLPNTASRGSDNLSVGYEPSHRSSTASLECSTPAQSDTPRPPQPNVNDVTSLRTAPNVSPRSRPTSLSRPQGDLFQPDPLTYRSTDKAPDSSTLERTISPTAWSSEEEEFMHVPCLTISQALDAFRDTVLGLEYLHYQGIIHRDIKPANLLWTSDYRVKISDFGVSYLGTPTRENEINDENSEADEEDLDEARELAKTVGTPAFYAPELCDPGLFDPAKRTDRPQITGQIDVWALGVTLYGMIFGRLAFFDVNEFAMYEKIATQEVFIPRMRLRAVGNATNEALNSNKRPDDILEYEEVDEELRDLLKRLLEKQPSKRTSLKEVKEHPWVVRGISDISAWMDQTDPSVQSQGKKIEVSTQEVQEAVVGLKLADMIRTGMKTIRSMVRGRDSRKRGHSNAKTSDSHTSTSPSTSKAASTTSSHEGRRRSSLRGDEQIYSALRASREGSEHPLSQSVAASPEMKQSDSYFDLGNLLTVSHDPTGGDPSAATRPNYLERTLSNAESTKTIRPPIPASMQEIASATAEPFPAVTLSTDLSLSSGLGGIFGGAGRRFVRGMRSRERGRGRDSPSLSSNSSSVAASATEDPHGLPSVAITPTVVTGHVDQPPVLQDPITPIDYGDHEHGPSSESHAHVPGESYFDPFHHSRSGDFYSWASSGRSLGSYHNRRHTVSSVTEVARSPSLDDRSYPIEASMVTAQPEDLSFPVSSSSDQITSGMSESTSYPSIPSVISGASLLSAHADECYSHPPPPVFADSSKTASEDSLGWEIEQPTVRAVNRRAAKQARMNTDDDEAGYNGEGEQDSDSDDEGIEMSGLKTKMI